MLLVAAIVGGAIGAGVTLGVQRATAPGGQRPVDLGSHVTISEESAIAGVADKAAPAVVSVTTQDGGTQAGSGFLVTNDGYVVTNLAVPANATHLNVVLSADDRPHDARLVTYDCQTGMAILKVDHAPNQSTLTFGDSSSLKPGETVVLLGGTPPYQSTVNQGIISGIDRGVTVPHPVDATRTLQLTGLAETDVQVDQSQNGGPLLNTSGQVVGILMRGESQGQPVSVALASNAIQAEVQQVIDTGDLVVPSLGAQTQERTPAEVAAQGGRSGSKVTAVTAGGPADRAGLRVGDVLTRLDDQSLNAGNPLPQVLRSKFKQRQHVTVSYARGDATGQVQLAMAGERAAC
jgi:putative serine protease PepD